MTPKVSFLIPTLNSEKVLEHCLHSISIQNYPQDKVEILIADGGSTDATLQVAQKYNAHILKNPLKTAESGKVVALHQSTGEYVALIDSDNYLPDENWLLQMTEPLEKHPEAVGSEPWSYIRRNEDGVITRYCAMMGVNDPLCYFLGNYDRYNWLTKKWTELPHEEKDYSNYLLVSFDKRGLPTIGANGTVFRASFLKENVSGDYLFDIDVLAQYISQHGLVNFIKVKNGIIHSFCESNFIKFAKKQRRRVNDYFYYTAHAYRKYEWHNEPFLPRIKFVLSTLLIFPLLIDSYKGFKINGDVAWFFHIPACVITLMEYGMGYIRGILFPKISDRKNWKQ